MMPSPSDVLPPLIDQPGAGGLWERKDAPKPQQQSVREVDPDPLQPVQSDLRRSDQDIPTGEVQVWMIA